MNLVNNFSKIRWCFNNNNKDLERMTKTGSYIRLCCIIIKTPSYRLKINKRTSIFAIAVLKCVFSHVCICFLALR